MRRIGLYILLIFCFLIVQSCANYKLNYSKEGKKWEQATPNTSDPLAHRMYLVGDAGNVPLNG